MVNRSARRLSRVAGHAAVAIALGLGAAIAATAPAQAATTVQVVDNAPTKDDCYRLMNNIVADAKNCYPDPKLSYRWDGYATWY
ncbi:hypothetical protein [Kribbella sp. CA-294648]|uniref:hypothetical protein n=1 Tax=Kribbella sp. CA-294648 TaxID=3239948 RepID=UPI003D91F470